MAFWRCFYHIIWATKYRQSSILPLCEKILFTAIIEKSTHLNCEVIAVNGTDNHVHVAVTIPPTLCPADWVKHVKGYSSRELNKTFSETMDRFQWQSGYGVLTFGARNQDIVVSYIQNQKQHHAEGTTIDYLERSDD